MPKETNQLILGIISLKNVPTFLFSLWNVNCCEIESSDLSWLIRRGRSEFLRLLRSSRCGTCSAFVALHPLHVDTKHVMEQVWVLTCDIYTQGPWTHWAVWSKLWGATPHTGKSLLWSDLAVTGPSLWQQDIGWISGPKQTDILWDAIW